jgi:hypothetical protein
MADNLKYNDDMRCYFIISFSRCVDAPVPPLSSALMMPVFPTLTLDIFVLVSSLAASVFLVIRDHQNRRRLTYPPGPWPKLVQHAGIILHPCALRYSSMLANLFFRFGGDDEHMVRYLPNSFPPGFNTDNTL